MLIMQESLPGINKFLKPVVMNSRARDLAISCIIAFLMHWGKMTATQAAGSVRSRPRHRAQICRFLGRKYWKRFDLLGPVQHALLELEAVKDGILSLSSIKPSARYKPNQLKTPITQETLRSVHKNPDANRKSIQNARVTAL